MSLMNSFFLFLSSVPLAWFLKTTSSSQRRFMAKSRELRRGLPRATSISRCSCSWAARSASSFAFWAARSCLIFSSSRIRAAVSSSSSSSELGTGRRGVSMVACEGLGGVLVVAAFALVAAIVCVNLAVFFEHFYSPPLRVYSVFVAVFGC